MSTTILRRPAIAAAVLAFLGLTLVLAHHRAAWAATTDVEVGDNFFRPQEITIAAGDTVRWTYNGFSQHNVQAADGSWASGDLTTGIPYSRTFDQPGEYAYFCKYHGGCSADGASCGGQFGRITVVGDEPAPEPSQTQQPSPEPSPTTSPEPSPTGAASPTAGPSSEATASPQPSQTPSPDGGADDGTPSPSPSPGTEEPMTGGSDATADGTDTGTAVDDDHPTASGGGSPSTDGEGTDVAAAADGGGAGGELKVLATLLVAGSAFGLMRTARADR